MSIFLSDRKYTEGQSPVQEKRESPRFKIIYPTIYVRFDHHGRECDQKPSRCVNMSLGGVRLQTSFSVGLGETLDTAIALENRLVPVEDRLVAFMGRVVYLIPSDEKQLQLGVSIEVIEDQEREKLFRFIDRIMVPGLRHGDAIVQKGQIACPVCGKQIESVVRVKQGVGILKRFWDHCACGQRYEAEAYSSGRMLLCFPDRRIGVVS